jgi:hypothetical protein
MIMTRPSRLIRSLFPLVVFLFLIPIGCSSKTSVPAVEGVTNPGLTLPTSEGVTIPGSTKPTTEGAANPVLTEPGATRKNPIPLNTLVSIPGWDIKVLEFLRGADALSVINTADWQAQPLPEGQEYALAKIFVKCTSLDDNYHSLGISEMFITGSHYMAHGDTMDGWPQPEFLFEDMFTADAIEGWIDAVIPTDEQNLMVVLDVRQDKNRYTRYFALQDGASISLPTDLANLNPNELGVNFSNPAPANQSVISPDWEVTVLNSIQGQEAATVLEKDNPNYSPPSEGMESLLLQVRLRYISSNDVPIWVSSDDFYPVDPSNGWRIPVDRIYANLQSDLVWLSGNILPGAEVEGWVALTIPTGTDRPIIAFDLDSYSSQQTEQNLRYLAIK